MGLKTDSHSEKGSFRETCIQYDPDSKQCEPQPKCHIQMKKKVPPQEDRFFSKRLQNRKSILKSISPRLFSGKRKKKNEIIEVDSPLSTFHVWYLNQDVIESKSIDISSPGPRYAEKNCEGLSVKGETANCKNLEAETENLRKELTAVSTSPKRPAHSESESRDGEVAVASNPKTNGASQGATIAQATDLSNREHCVEDSNVETMELQRVPPLIGVREGHSTIRRDADPSSPVERTESKNVTCRGSSDVHLTHQKAVLKDKKLSSVPATVKTLILLRPAQSEKENDDKDVESQMPVWAGKMHSGEKENVMSSTDCKTEKRNEPRDIQTSTAEEMAGEEMIARESFIEERADCTNCEPRSSPKPVPAETKNIHKDLETVQTFVQRESADYGEEEEVPCLDPSASAPKENDTRNETITESSTEFRGERSTQEFRATDHGEDVPANNILNLLVPVTVAMATSAREPKAKIIDKSTREISSSPGYERRRTSYISSQATSKEDNVDIANTAMPGETASNDDACVAAASESISSAPPESAEALSENTVDAATESAEVCTTKTSGVDDGETSNSPGQNRESDEVDDRNPPTDSSDSQDEAVAHVNDPGWISVGRCHDKDESSALTHRRVKLKEEEEEESCHPVMETQPRLTSHVEPVVQSSRLRQGGVAVGLAETPGSETPDSQQEEYRTRPQHGSELFSSQILLTAEAEDRAPNNFIPREANASRDESTSVASRTTECHISAASGFQSYQTSANPSEFSPSGVRMDNSQHVEPCFNPIEGIKLTDSVLSIAKGSFGDKKGKLRMLVSHNSENDRTNQRGTPPKLRVVIRTPPVCKKERSSARPGWEKEPFLTSDLQDIHAGRQKDTEQSLAGGILQQFRTSLSRPSQEDPSTLWITTFGRDHTFHHVIIACPFFPVNFHPTDRGLMRLESMRLASFLPYSHSHRLSTLRLANAGFYCEGGGLVCYFCGVTIGQDETNPEQDPYTLHRARSPNCPLFDPSSETRNVFIQDDQRQALSGRDITGGGSEESSLLVHEQVQTSRQSMSSAIVQYASGAASLGTTSTSDSGYYSSGDPSSGHLSAATQGASAAGDHLHSGGNRSVDSVASVDPVAPTATEGGQATVSQDPRSQAPGHRTATAPVNQARSSPPALGEPHSQQALPSSSAPQNQRPEGEETAGRTSNSTPAQQNEPSVQSASLGHGSSGQNTGISTTGAPTTNPPGYVSMPAAPTSVSYPAPAAPNYVLAVTGAPGFGTFRHDGEALPPNTAGATTAAATAAAGTVYDRNLATHKKYADLQRREQSFLGWPDTHAQSPGELSVAGFFYTGIGDCVRCHYCGLGLKHWDPDDKPIDEHVRWRSSCGYLQTFLGRDIIARTMARLAQTRRGEVPPRSETSESVVAGLVGEFTGVGGQTEGSAGADNSTTPRETEADALMTSEAAQLAREMGFPDNLIHRSIKALLQTRAGRRAVTPNNVAQTILYLRERGGEPQENPEPAAELGDTETNGDNDGEDDDDEEENRTSPPGNGSATSSGSNTSQGSSTPAQANHSEVLVYHASAEYGSPGRETKSTESSSGETMSSTRSSISGRSTSSSGDSGYGSGSSFDGSSLSSGGSSGATSSNNSSGRLPAIPEGTATRESIRQLEQENQELLERRRCKICLDSDVGVLFLPCGHLVCCEECAPALRRCPMCRKRISSNIRTKLSPIPNDGQG